MLIQNWNSFITEMTFIAKGRIFACYSEEKKLPSGIWNGKGIWETLQVPGWFEKTLSTQY